MNPDRRLILRAGVSATLWAAFGGGLSAQPVPTRLATDGFRLFDAAQVEARIAPLPAPATAALGYEGATPGPLLRLRKGEELKIRLTNRLSEPTTLCWPGLRIANSMAGIGGLTQAPAPPGGSFDYRFTPPDSGFNLYRPHVGVATPGQIGRGLYGPIVVEEASPPQCDLEAVVALTDWSLDDKGQVRDDFSGPAAARGAGHLGGAIAANNGPAPLSLNASPGARVRLRLVNAANARMMAIGVEGVKPLIIALDGQPAEPFQPLHNVFPMGPQARFDMMFDMPRDGAPVRFILFGGAAAAIPGEADRPLIAFAATGDPLAQRPPLTGLPANPSLPVEIDLQRAKRVDMTIAGGGGAPFSINGATLRDWPVKPLFAVARSAPVTLGIVNNTAVTQAIRLYGHSMRLLHAMDDGWEPYWRDNVLIAPGKTSHVAFVADNPGHWPIESAIAEHMAAGVMTMFAVG
ncbi:MAG TPA: multicopper oxidase family protein [Roseiarcus sp.]|jgi:FtsP/CotA-like multicopper oxidase with cupredoxin domain